MLDPVKPKVNLDAPLFRCPVEFLSLQFVTTWMGGENSGQTGAWQSEAIEKKKKLTIDVSLGSVRCY